MAGLIGGECRDAATCPQGPGYAKEDTLMDTDFLKELDEAGDVEMQEDSFQMPPNSFERLELASILSNDLTYDIKYKAHSRKSVDLITFKIPYGSRLSFGRQRQLAAFWAMLDSAKTTPGSVEISAGPVADAIATMLHAIIEVSKPRSKSRHVLEHVCKAKIQNLLSNPHLVPSSEFKPWRLREEEIATFCQQLDCQIAKAHTLELAEMYENRLMDTTVFAHKDWGAHTGTFLPAATELLNTKAQDSIATAVWAMYKYKIVLDGWARTMRGNPLPIRAEYLQLERVFLECFQGC